MSDIIFVVPDEYPEYYATYTDYYKLAALANFGLCRRSAMDITNPAHCYIVTWFDVQHGGWAGAKARIILWNLEWASAINPLDKIGYITPRNLVPGVSEIWSPDAGFAAQQEWKYVPVGSHPGLALRPYDAPTNYAYDVTLQMYRDPQRRRRVIDELQRRHVRIAPDAWGDGRHQSMVHSRMQVHIHQHDNMNVVSPLRFAVAATYRKPIIAETIDDLGIFSGLLIRASYDEIANAVDLWLKMDSSYLQDMGDRLYQMLCVDNPFGHIVKANV